MGLRWKIAALTGACAALVAVILVFSFALQMRQMATDELRKRGQSVTVQVANSSAFEIFSRDTEGLKSAAESTLRDIPDVAYVVMRDAQGKVLSEARAQDVPSLPKGAPAPSTELAATGAELEVGALQVLHFGGPVKLEQQARPTVADETVDPMELMAAGGFAPKPEVAPAAGAETAEIGAVEVGFRMDPLQQEISGITTRAVLIGLLALLGGLAASILLTRLLTVPLERLAKAAVGVASGDLRQKIDTNGTDEIAEVARSFDGMMGSLRGLLGDLRSAASDVEKEAASILATATQQSAMASHQSSAISETSTTVTEIAETSRQATEHADSVIGVTQKSEELSRTGQRAIEESVAAMEKLGDQVREIALTMTDLSERAVQIGDIISTVRDLAERSNLLALNASIEAAKAGEHGKGFAVVAMEMRNLADQSKLAAGQVRAIITEVQKGTRAAVAATDEGSKRAMSTMTLTQGAGANFQGMVDVVRESALAARQIAGNTRQQTIGVEQILSAITQLQRSMSETLEGTRGIEKVAGSLKTLSGRLTELTNRYEV